MFLSLSAFECTLHQRRLGRAVIARRRSCECEMCRCTWSPTFGFVATYSSSDVTRWLPPHILSSPHVAPPPRLQLAPWSVGESYAADLDLCVFVRMGSALTADGPAAQHNTWTPFLGVVKTGRELDTTGGLWSLSVSKWNCLPHREKGKH